MNNKGFTLIELIIVIALLAVIALLTTPNIIKMLEKNKIDNYNNTIDAIIEAAELYVSNNKYNLSFKDSEYNSDYCSPSDTKDVYAYITLQHLIDSKDIKGEVKNYCTNGEVYPDEISIKIILNCKTRNFSYELYDAGDSFFSDDNSQIIKIDDCSNLN